MDKTADKGERTMSICKKCKYYSEYQQECTMYNMNEDVAECSEYKEKEQ